MVVCKFFQQGNCRYGQNCRFDHFYGSKYSYRAPQTQIENNQEYEDFSRSMQGSRNDAATSLFRSAVKSTSVYNPPSNNNVFGQNSNSRMSVFDRLGPQQNSGGFQNNQAKSIFSQANQNVFQAQPSNVFQQNQVAKSIFAQANQNVFAPARSENVFNQPSQSAAGLFASAAKSLQQNSSPFSTGGNVFKISEQPVPTSNVFASSVFDQNSDCEEGIYSKLEDLMQTDIEAFESVEFKLGFIPELPPPKSLCA